ncbi:alpha/beta hydrolase [Candidatus Saccharibacteria bacterium]|nr:alpha/beta hydrolase [Candidatus Saccharibacteria bacterium]
MKKAIIIHSWITKRKFYDPARPTPSNADWLPWLSKQLIIRGIHTVAPEMPRVYYPEYDIWKKELERFELDEDTTLIGHSCGAGFLVRYLSENPVKVGKVILVAPWLGIIPDDLREYAPSEILEPTFFEFKIDRNLATRTAGLTLIESTNDKPYIQKSVEILKESLNDLRVLTLKDKGHFWAKDLGGVEFPELLAEVLR